MVNKPAHRRNNIPISQHVSYWPNVTTVGYGDVVPVTLAGRAIGLVLMLGGIAFFSGVTANLASFLIKGKDTGKTEMALLTKEIERLREDIAALRSGSSG